MKAFFEKTINEKIRLVIALLFLLPPFSLTSAHDDPSSISKSSDDEIVLRRTTLIVRDVEHSLNLYRDSIGMEVIYDQVIERGEKEIRLVFLKTKDDYIGVLGLVDYEYNHPEAEAKRKPVRKEGFTPQSPVLVFNTNDLENKWKMIMKVEGVDIIQEPTYTEYPSYDGSSVIKVRVSKFYDVDGYLIELNQVLSSIH